MMQAPERSPERDAAIDALLPNVPFDGWTFKALRMGLAGAGWLRMTPNCCSRAARTT